MKIKPTLTTLCLMMSVMALSACSNDPAEDSHEQPNQAATSANSRSKVSSDLNNARFEVTVEGLLEFQQTSKRTKAFNYKNDLWEFKGDGALIRLAGRFDEVVFDTEQVSQDLEYNNVYLEFYQSIEGKNTRISCKPASEPEGNIVRVINQDLSSSGRFELKFILCRNTYTSEPIKTIQVPLKVTGDFKDVAYSESLF